MTVSDILKSKGMGVITIDVGDTIKRAAEKMVEYNIAALVVTQSNRPIGLVSERDIVRALAEHDSRSGAQPIRQLVKDRMISIASDDSIKRAMSMMTRGRMRHLPVTYDGEIIGIVSLGDVVKHRLEDLEMETNVLRDMYIATH